MNFKFVIILLLLLYVAIFTGCASIDRLALTRFEYYTGPNSEKMFKFFSKSDIFYPANTEAGEAIRMRWLEKWLSDNSYCPNGYKIIEKKEVSIGGWEAAKDIYYTGKCS